jgi:hypothetical protein
MGLELRIDAARLNGAVRAIFAAAGSNPRECGLVADHLVEANLRGHDSHGVGMIPAYIGNAKLGEMRLNAAPKVAADTGSLLVCEGDLGLGQTMAHDSIAMAIERAKASGVCILALRHSHHIGRIGAWAAMRRRRAGVAPLRQRHQHAGRRAFRRAGAAGGHQPGLHRLPPPRPGAGDRRFRNQQARGRQGPGRLQQGRARA